MARQPWLFLSIVLLDAEVRKALPSCAQFVHNALTRVCTMVHAQMHANACMCKYASKERMCVLPWQVDSRGRVFEGIHFK